MATSVMPSPRCSFNVNSALALVPSTWKPDAAPAGGFEVAGVAGRATGTAGVDGVVTGALGLRLALGRIAVFRLVFAAGLGFAAGLVLLAGLVLFAGLAPTCL